MERTFMRPNGDMADLSDAATIIARFVSGSPASKYDITVGTDSQNFDKTKIVEVIAVHRVGSGGIFFYRVDFVRRIDNLRQKIQEETSRSIAIADSLVDMLGKAMAGLGLDIDALDVHMSIHCDVGYNGRTRALIQEIVGWVNASGYDCRIKPDSYAASGVANKYSK